MKINEHPNPADIMNQKIVGYIYEPEDFDSIIIVLENYNIKVPFSTLIIKSRNEPI